MSVVKQGSFHSGSVENAGRAIKVARTGKHGWSHLSHAAKDRTLLSWQGRML